MIKRLGKAWQALFAQDDSDVSFGGNWHPATGIGDSNRVSSSGQHVTPNSALSVAAYYAAIRAISEDEAKLPFPVFESLEPRGKERLRDHAVTQLLSREPNPEMTAFSFRETLTANTLGWGNGYAEIQRNGMGDPVALWPIHPSRVRVCRTSGGELMYEIGNDDGSKAQINQSNMFHLHGLGGDGITGWSVAKLAADSLGLAIAAQKFGGSFFANGTNVGAVLKHPGQLGEEGADNLRRSWNQRYSGASKGNQVLILEEGMEYTQLGIPPEDAQFLETRQFQVEEVARWFRIPPHKIQHLENATFSNIESQAIEYVQDCLTPWLVRWEQEVQRKLLGTDADNFAQHVVTALLRGDQAARSTFYREQFNIGAMSQNDIRELENANPIEGGDTYYINGAMVPSHLAAEGANVVQPMGSQPAGDDEDDVPAEPGVDEEAIIASMAPAFQSASERVATKARKAMERAAKKHDPLEYSKWLAGFAEELQADALVALLPVANSLASVLASTRGEDVPSYVVAELTKVWADRYVLELCLGDEGTDPDPTAHWLRDAIAGATDD